MSFDCFDSDALIYAAEPGHPLGRRVWKLLDDPSVQAAGSVLLLPELLIKPRRLGNTSDESAVAAVLDSVRMYEVDRVTADYATLLGAKYGLRAADAVHLATAAVIGADRFITNNSKDFGKDIDEVEVVYPAELSG